jgi:hypothetical protein
MIDPWAAGYLGEADAAGTRRILRPIDVDALRRLPPPSITRGTASFPRP